MSRNSKPYRYVHPEHIISTYICTDSDGTQLIFRCPMCPMYGEKASFSLIERVGRCFVCKGIIKLHSMYDNIPVEVLFKDLVQRTPVPTQGSDKPASRAKIVTRPLSQASLEYIASRGIPMDVVQQFSVLAETTYYGNLYLAWRTSAGGYELRATFQTKWAKITPHGHPKAFTLVRLMPDASTCIVCEGLFSALSYAQLFPRLDAWYVILNSTSNADQLAHALPTLTAAGIQRWVLALDNDERGQQTTKALRKAMNEAGLTCTITIPEHDGEDWNDALLRGADPLSPVTVLHDEESGEVVPEQPGGNDKVSPTDRDSESSAIVLVHDADAPPDTVGSLSHANQTITAAYYEDLLATREKVVVAAPCGLGKTYTAAEYMATHWHEGVLYVAERNEQLVTMQRLLSTLGVPPELIGTYYAGSADLKELRQDHHHKALALVTHARMQAFPPEAYLLMHKQGGVSRRRLMIVDESICPLLILKVPEMFVKGLLAEMGLQFADTGKLEADEIDRHIAGIAPLLRRHARFSFKSVGIEAEYIAWTDSLPPIDTVLEARGFAYYCMMYHILAGTYMTSEQDVRVLVPMTPHLSWFKAFEQILVLDATAPLTDYLYQDYTIVQPGTWNYTDITLAYKVLSAIGDLTKTTMQTYKESFLQELQISVRQTFDIGEFRHPYVVTFKAFADDVRSLL
jgi:hypothetical protein